MGRNREQRAAKEESSKVASWDVVTGFGEEYATVVGEVVDGPTW